MSDVLRRINYFTLWGSQIDISALYCILFMQLNVKKLTKSISSVVLNVCAPFGSLLRSSLVCDG